MPGQAVVSINENQWQVSLASTYDELTTGLRGVTSLAAGTGMLFVLPSSQAASIDTRGMNFALDIIFISNDTVIDVIPNVQPGYLVTEETPCDFFLEVNAGEAAGVEAGDTVSTTTIQEAGLDFSQIMSFAVPLVTLGFVCAMAGGMASMIGSSPTSGQRRLGEPKSRAERLETHERKYGTRELPERGKGLGPRQSQEEEVRFIGACKVVNGLCQTHDYSVSKAVRCPKSPLTDEEWAAAWELAEAAYPKGMSNPWVNGWWPETPEEAEKAAREYERKMRNAIYVFREKQAKAMENYERGADKAIYNYRRYVTAEYEKGMELSAVASPSEHHSMWLTLEQRKELEKKYGAVAVRWAEEATRAGDVKGVEVAAEYYHGKLKEVFGLGHLSPKLSEQQLKKLREVLGLPVDVAEVLKIHRETGYVP